MKITAPSCKSSFLGVSRGTRCFGRWGAVAALAGAWFLAVAGLFGPYPARATVILNTFNGTGFGFDYGSFTGNITNISDYVQIGNATEQGGAGTSGTWNLSSYYPSGQISVEVRLLSSNAADNFNIILFSSPTDYHGYQLSTALLNTVTFTTLTFNLNAPTFTSGTMNWASITEYQIQGDYSTTDNFSMQFKNLQVVPEPAAWALVGAGLSMMTIFRRRHPRRT